MPYFRAFKLALILGGSVGLSLNANAEFGAFSGWGQAQHGLPSITSFDVPPTRHNGEIWGFAAGEDGKIWVGSDELSSFDGRIRENVELPFGTYAVRALATTRNGTLWLGAIGEIGHLEHRKTGGWNYVSAKDDLARCGVTDLRDVWCAHAKGNQVTFVADQEVMEWNGTGFESWRLPSEPFLRANEDGDRLWIIQSGVGLLRMSETGPILELREKDYPGHVALWAFSLPDAEDPKAILLGTGDGVFLGSPGRWRRLSTISKVISGKVPWRAVLLNHDTFAIAEYLGGLVIGTTSDEWLATLDRTTGLPNESITGLWYNGRQDLWLGYPGGMLRLEAHAAVTMFDNRNGLSDPALKIIQHGNDTYVLSRRMLGRIKVRETGKPATIVQSAYLESPLSDAVTIGPDLCFSAYGSGEIWRLGANAPQQLQRKSGYIFALLNLHQASDTLLVLRDTQLEALDVRNPNAWQPIGSSYDIGGYPLNMVETGDGDVWVSTVTNGIFRFRIASQPGTQAGVTLIKHFTEKNGLPRPLERPQLTPFGGSVFVLSAAEILRYDRSADAFVSTKEFAAFSGVAATATDNPRQAYWIVRNHMLTQGALDQDVLVEVWHDPVSKTFGWRPMNVPALSEAGRILAIHYTKDDSGLLWISGSQALVRVALAGLPPSEKLPQLQIGRIEDNDHLLQLPAAGSQLKLTAEATRLQFGLAGNLRADGTAAFVQASVDGHANEWMKPQLDPTFTFPALRPGSYLFRARVVDAFGRPGPVTSIRFDLPAPWYERSVAIACYIALFLTALYCGVRVRLSRLRRQNERLNALVDERTYELAQANMVKNEFLENISHEIRNPLNGISNLVDLLRDAPLKPEERRLTQSLQRSTEHLKRVFSDVLGYTQLEYGHMRLNSEPFSPVQLLEDVVALYGVQARESKTELILRFLPPWADGFIGDAEKIRAIVGNFLSNALKYAPGKPVEIVASLIPLAAAKQYKLRVEVIDQGPGIPAADQEFLFQKFSRGSNANVAGITGTGLGLAICRGLAELMDGAAGVRSDAPKGAHFWAEMRVEQCEIKPVGLSAGPAPDLPSPTTRALIIEDQEYNQAVLLGIARRLGLEADVASEASEVWPLISLRSYTTVFVDWELPGMNGGEIAYELRKHPNTANAVIVTTTAHDNDDIRQKCLEAQMDGFAVKPFDTERLRAVLAAANARRAGCVTNTAAVRFDVKEPGPGGNQLSFGAFRYFKEGNPDQASQAKVRYLELLDQELHSLATAAAKGDREAVARSAHRLRSHGSLVNGGAICSAAQTLVSAARDIQNMNWQVHLESVFAAGAQLRLAITSATADSLEAG